MEGIRVSERIPWPKDKKEKKDPNKPDIKFIETTSFSQLIASNNFQK